MNSIVISPIKVSILDGEVRVKERRRQRIPEHEAAIARRGRGLKRLDNELAKGNFKASLSIVKQLQRNSGLRGFGIAEKRKASPSAFDEIKLNGVTDSSVYVIIDLILRSIKGRQNFQMQDTETEEHEAGHFLVGYMLGVLPKRYKVPSEVDLLRDEFASGHVEFIGFEFLKDVGAYSMSNKKLAGGRLSNKVLRSFLCVTIGGLVAEHLSFGCSELLYSDVGKFHRVLQKLDFTENEIDSAVRRAVEDTVLMLGPLTKARCELAEAMSSGRSIGLCIDTIERMFIF